MSETIKEQDQKLNEFEAKAENWYIYTSSVESNKVIDCKIQEFVDQDELMRFNRESYRRPEFSKADIDLDRLYQF